MSGQKHVLDAGPGSLMIFDPIIHLFLIKVNGNQDRRGADNMSIKGQLRKPVADAAVLDDGKTPRLVVEAERHPDACAENMFDQAALDRLAGEFPEVLG
jgi:hypothetical protein